MQIPVIHQNKDLYNGFAACIEKSTPEGTCFLEEIGSYGPSNPGDIFVVIEPFRINRQFVSIASIWKDHLSITAPDTKLVVAGLLAVEDHKNYIDLLRFPQNFVSFIEDAEPVSNMAEIPVDGQDIRLLLRRFLRGHGKDFLFEHVTGLYRKLHGAYDALNQGEGYDFLINRLFPRIVDGPLSIFLDRMHTYSPYFEFLPAELQIQPFEPVLGELQSFFFSGQIPSEEQFRTSAFDRKLWDLIAVLDSIRRLYPPEM